MNWTLLRATLHQRRASMFWFSFGLILYSWMMTWFWPQMGGDQYAQMLESFSPELLQIFGGTDVPFASLGGFFQVEYLGLMWILIVSSALIMFAVKAFAGEISGGTMEFVLAQPVSRVRLAITRVVALVLYVLVLAASSFVPIQVLGRQYDVVLSAETFWLLFAFGTMFMLAVGGIAMLLSATFRDGGKPGAIAAGLLVLMWVADLISNVSDAAGFFDSVNLVSYWQPGKIINDGVVSGEAWWLYGIVAAVSLVGAVAVFSRRDVA
jgi:ABC-2 type transport system permease protein